VKYTKVMKLRTLRRKGVAFTVFSSDKTVQDTLTAEMLRRVRSVKSFSKAAVGDLLLAKRSMRLRAARGSGSSRQSATAHLRRGQRIRLRVTVNDPSAQPGGEARHDPLEVRCSPTSQVHISTTLPSGSLT
jgi:hypothetical protein